MSENKKLTFLYLSTFSTHGGIEKFNRALLKALHELQQKTKVYSLYDTEGNLDSAYWPDLPNFQGRKQGRLLDSFRFLFQQIFTASGPLLIGHLNLAPLILPLMYLRSDRPVILIAHGIEVWSELSFFKKYFLRKVDQVWAVSNYTRQRLQENFPHLSDKVKVFPNTLDPYFPMPAPAKKNQELVDRYRILENEKVILTLARISSAEGYKGYDRLVEALPLIKQQPVRYLIAGKYDVAEKNRIIKIAKDLKVEKQLVFCGFIAEAELIAHYQLADVFAMPSLQEGFGIVFIEALACGTPVIAGNKDGSVDALKGGELGRLIDPTDPMAIAEALDRLLFDPQLKDFAAQADRIQKVQAIFGFSSFKKRLKEFLQAIPD